MKRPTYVSLNGTILKWEDFYKQFYRPAGEWGVTYTRKEGKIYAIGIGSTEHLNGVELKPATREEYENDNYGYLPGQ